MVLFFFEPAQLVDLSSTTNRQSTDCVGLDEPVPS